VCPKGKAVTPNLHRSTSAFGGALRSWPRRTSWPRTRIPVWSLSELSELLAQIPPSWNEYRAVRQSRRTELVKGQLQICGRRNMSLEGATPRNTALDVRHLLG
jgi:hypothetical protein